MTARVIFINTCLHSLRVSTIFQALCVNAILILDELIKSALSSKEDPWPKLSICVWTYPPLQDCWYLTELPGLGLQLVLSLSSTQCCFACHTVCQEVTCMPVGTCALPGPLISAQDWGFPLYENWNLTLSTVWQH